MTASAANGERTQWLNRTRIILQPIAPPSILGLYGFAGATFIVATHMAGWYGDDTSALILAPFAAFFGGLAQFLAGMWAYRARDGVATAMHGMWGSFWLAYGLLHFLAAIGAVTLPTGAYFPELGYWFIALAAITWAGAIAASAESGALVGVLATLAAGSTLAAIAFVGGSSVIEVIAGWVFIVSAVIAFYTASAMMFAGTFGRVVLPLGKYSKTANVPGGVITEPIEYPAGHPGVRVGQ